MNKLFLYILLIVAILGFGILYKNKTPKTSSTPAQKVAIANISTRADDIPPARVWTESKTVKANLHATQVVAELADGVTYEYWTYNNQVPGPFIRAIEGDMVEITLTHEHAHGGDSHSMIEKLEDSFSIKSFVSAVSAQSSDDGHAHSDGQEHSHEGDAVQSDGHMMSAEDMNHMAEGHGEHSIDLHSVLGPGGGAEMTRVGPNTTKAFRFKAMRPGIYVYHCASPHVPSHIANGMYGLILVEPKAGLSKVDHEYYVMQGEFYTTGKLGVKGHQFLDKDKLLNERPEYIVFNGRKGALVGDGALRAKVGEKVRIFFGVSGQLASNFHIIGGIFDKLYPEGDIISSPHKNVQTTLVPAGGATMVEFTSEVPGKYLLVDHALTRAIDRGAVGELIVEGEDQPEIIKKIQ